MWFAGKEAAQTVNTIPVHSNIFKKILSWLQYHRIDEYEKIEELEFEDLDEFDQEFFSVDDHTLMAIFKAAHWLAIEPLLEECAIALARAMESKSVEEIREVFKEVNDLEPEEEELLRKEAEQYIMSN